MSASEATQLRRRQADLADRINSVRVPGPSGSPSLVMKITAIPSGTGPRFFPVALSQASGPNYPVAGDAGVFADDTVPDFALSLTGGPATTTNHILATQVDGVWCFEG